MRTLRFRGVQRQQLRPRALVGILSILQLIGGIYQLIFLEGALRWHGLWQAIFAGLILYLLYNRDSDRFFASR